MKNVFPNHTLRTNQSGIASILVTMIMMIVISLIVLGYAAISRQEQANSLNTQLSSQAFYAAETGVNDAQQLISQQLQSSPTIADKTSCGAGGSYSTLTGIIDTSPQISYTCLLIDAAPPTLQYNNVDSDSTVIPVNNLNTSQPLGSLTLQWRPNTEDANNTIPSIGGCPTNATYHTLPSQTVWNNNNSQCGFGVLRVELVPTTTTNGTTDLDATDLLNDEMTVFLMPTSSGGQTQISYADCNPSTPGGTDPSGCGAIVPVQCLDDGTVNGTYCQIKLIGLLVPGYSLRVQTIYGSSSLTITPPTGISLSDAQVLIDSTGEAENVLRRLQVRLSLNSDSLTEVPDDAIQAGANICGQFTVATGYFNDQSGCTAQTPPVIYVPPPGGGGSPPTGTGGIGNCITDPSNAFCTSPPARTPRLFYWALWFNTSNIPAGQTVIACTWTWGDGTTTVGTVNGTFTQNGYNVVTGDLSQGQGSCGTGDAITHCFPYAPGSYTPTLVETLSDGTSTPPVTFEPPQIIPNVKTQYTQSGEWCSLPD
jgi:hypothetical protein